MRTHSTSGIRDKPWIDAAPEPEDQIENDIEIVINGNECPIRYSEIVKACERRNYTMSLTGRDAEVLAEAVSIGIDCRFQSCSGPEDDYEQGTRAIIASEDAANWNAGDKLILAHTLECSITPDSLCVLLRRLFDDMHDTGEDDDSADVGRSLADSILLTLGFDEMSTFVGRVALGLE